MISFDAHMIHLNRCPSNPKPRSSARRSGMPRSGSVSMLVGSSRPGYTAACNGLECTRPVRSPRRRTRRSWGIGREGIMIFCVPIFPFLRVHATSTRSIEHAVDTLAEIGIQGIRLNAPAPDQSFDHDHWVRVALDRACARGFRICTHAPATDICATDPAARQEAVAEVRQAICVLGACVPGLVVAVHPENFAPIRSPGDAAAREENCRSVTVHGS